MSICPNCGALGSDEGNSFCENCGVMLPTNPTETSGSDLFSRQSSATEGAGGQATSSVPSFSSQTGDPAGTPSGAFSSSPASGGGGFGSSSPSTPQPPAFTPGTVIPDSDERAAQDALNRALEKAGAKPLKAPAPQMPAQAEVQNDAAAPAGQQSPAQSAEPFTQQSAFSVPASWADDEPSSAPPAEPSDGEAESPFTQQSVPATDVFSSGDAVSSGGLFGEGAAPDVDATRQVFPRATQDQAQRMPQSPGQETNLFEMFGENAPTGGEGFGQTQVFGNVGPAQTPGPPSGFDISKVTQAAEEAMPGQERNLFAPEEAAAGEEAADWQKPYEERPGEARRQQEAARDDRSRQADPQNRQYGQQRRFGPERNDPRNDPRNRRPQEAAQQSYNPEGNRAPQGGQRQQPRAMADYSNGAPRVAPPQQRDGDPRRAARRPPPQPNYPVKTRSGGAGVVVRNILIGVLIFMVAAFLILVGLLYWNNRPAAAIESFTTALSQRNSAALRESVQMAESLRTRVIKDEEWNALFDAFADSAKLDALATELKATGVSSDTGLTSDTSLTYPAITVKKESLFFLINTHYISISGVILRLPGGGESTVLRINGTDYIPNTEKEGIPSSADGAVYGYFMPGLYTCQNVVNGSATGDEMKVEAFQVSAPNNITAGTAGAGNAATTAEVTVSNCLSDDGIVSVNGQQVSVKPVSGIVVLQDVPVGTEISIVVEDNGDKKQASVTFSDASVTSLSFGDYTVTGKAEKDENDPTVFAEKATAAEVNEVLGRFYTSYLECINQQKMDPLTATTEANRSALAGRVTSPANAANTYKYVSATCDESSMKASADGDTPKLTMNGSFAYTYVPREGDDTTEKQGGNKQKVEMLYVDGNWLVNSMTLTE